MIGAAVGGSLGVAISHALGRGAGSRRFHPSRLFAAGEQGVWYDPSDFERYMVRGGPELVTNGTFADTSGWTAANSTLSAAGGVLTVTATGNVTAARATQNITAVVGRTYEMVFTIQRVSGASSAGAFIAVGATATSTYTAGTDTNSYVRRMQFTATGTTVTLVLDQAGASGAIGDQTKFSLVSVKELTALDTATLFQDSAGTTPVTAVEQPVGFIMDKRLGGVRGSELRAGFAPASFGVPPGAATFNTSTGAGTAPRTDASNNAWVSLSGLTIGAVYEITVQNTGAATISIRTNGAATSLVAAITTGQTVTARVAPVTTGNLAIVNTADGTTATFVITSVKLIPGNHASQATAAARPVLSARVNGLTATDMQGGTAGTVGSGAVAPTGWVFINTGGTVSYPASAYGGTALRTASADGVQRPCIGYSLTLAANEARTHSFIVEAVHSGTLTIGALCNVGGLPAGATQTFTINGVSRPSTANVATGDVCTTTITTNGTGGAVQFRAGVGASAGAIGDITIAKPQVEPGTVLTRYQRVNTATDYDAAGFPYYLKFDGVDDSLATGNIDFTATDKVTLFAGVHKASDAATAIVCELGPISDSTNGTFSLLAPALSGTNKYEMRAKGSTSYAAAITTSATFNAPHTAVLTGAMDIAGDAVSLRANGAQVASSAADQGTGMCANQPLNLGRRNSASLPLNGRIYNLIVRGAATTAANIASTERYVAGKTGVSL